MPARLFAALPAPLTRWIGASLSRRLTAGLMVAMLVSALVLVALALSLQQQALQREHEAAATRLARVFEASLQNAMLKRDLAGMADVLASLGQTPGVAQARLVEPQHGQVRFASQAALVGQNAGPQLSGLCLSAGCAPFSPAPAARATWQTNAQGLALQLAYPIANQPRCAQCHGPASARPVNGVLVIDFQPLRQQHAQTLAGASPTALLLAVGLGALAVFAAIMAWTLKRQVTQPLSRLAATADRFAGGDLTARFSTAKTPENGVDTAASTIKNEAPGDPDDPGADELRLLAQRFDHMAGRIQDAMTQLQGQQRFLQALVDAIPDPVLVIGADYRIRLANAAYARLVGQPPAAIVGQCCHVAGRNHAQPCPATLVTCPVQEIRQRAAGRGSAQPLRSMMRMSRSDGSGVEVDIEAAPLVTPEGQVLTIEVLRPLERTLRFSQEQRLSTIGLLANGVAHEIHNPLASIRLALQACLRGLGNGSMAPGELVDYLKLVDTEIDRCVLTTQRLLQMSTLPSQTLQPVAVERAVDDVLALLREECRAHAVQIQLHCTPATVLGDDAELRQVLVNLLHNALNAMPAQHADAQPGAHQRHISITGALQPGASHYLLTVQDSGIGIAADDLALIFLPFFSRRADGRRGTGLGLAICKAIVERFGGSIGVESKPGQGSRFTVTLRIAGAQDAPTAPATSATPADSAAPDPFNPWPS